MPKEIKILSICFFIIFFAYNGVQQFLTPYFSDLGAVKTGFWSLILIYLFLLITNFFSGFIVSRFGVKKCLILGSLFYSLFIFCLVSQNHYFIYLTSALLGFGASILWTAQGTLLVRASAENNYGRNSGLFSTIFHLGSVLGIIVFSVFAAKFSFKPPFLIFGTIPLIAVFLFLTFKNVEPKIADWREGCKKFKKLMLNPVAFRFSLIWFSFSLIIASVAGKFPLEIKKYFGLSSIGFLTSIFYFLPIVFSYFAGKISDTKGRKSFLVAAYILALLGLILFMLQAKLELNRVFFVLSFILISLGFAIYSPLRYALLGDVASEDNLEYFTALSLFANNGGYVVVFLLNIYLPAIFSYLIPFLLILISLIIISPVLKLNINKLKEGINL